MKLLFCAASITLFAFVSGCSTMMASDEATPANCKVALAQPARINFDASKQTELEKSEARAALANSPYRMALLNTPQGMNGNIEQALRDCH